MFERLRLRWCGCNQKQMQRVFDSCAFAKPTDIAGVSVFCTKRLGCGVCVSMSRSGVKVAFNNDQYRGVLTVIIGATGETVNVTKTMGPWHKLAIGIVSDVLEELDRREEKVLSDCVEKIRSIECRQGKL